MSLFKQAFDGIIDEYNNMFNYVYPSRGKKGFTERNLTCRFCKQLELQAKKTQFNTITWFEFPLEKKENKKGIPHVDAVTFLFGETSNAVILIESKRVTENKYAEKEQQIIDDVKRMRNEKTWKHLINPEYLHPSRQNNRFEIYTVILADIWNTKEEALLFLQNWDSNIPVKLNWPTDHFFKSPIHKLTQLQTVKKWKNSPYYLLFAWNQIEP